MDPDENYSVHLTANSREAPMNSNNLLTVLVVVYNKKVCQSTTIASLVELAEFIPRISKLLIWSNGPESNFLHCEQENSEILACFPNVEYIETTENLSLSVIYNRFVSANESDLYLILDDDSKIIEFPDISQFAKQKRPIVCVPRIFSNSINDIKNKRIIYPREAGGLGRVSTTGGKLMSISSGLLFNYELVKFFEEKNGYLFDERFSFYGVDSSFFLDTYRFGVYIHVSGALNHDLSILSNAVNSEFRIYERSKAIATLVNTRFSWLSLYYLVKVITSHCAKNIRVNFRVIFRYLF